MKRYIVHTVEHCLQYVKASNKKEAKKKVNPHSMPHIVVTRVEKTP